MSRITVLELIHNLRAEGAQVMVRNLVTAIDTARFRPVVCAWRHGGPLRASLEASGIQVFEPSDSVRALRIAILPYLISLIRREGVTMIHAHMSDCAVLGSLLHSLIRVPLVITHHSPRLVPKMSWYKERIRWRLLNRATRHAQRTIAVSEGVRSAIGAALPIDDKDVPLIRNGVPLPATLCRVHATTRSAIVGDDGDATVWPKVICVGRLIESKGHNQLIAAIPAVLRRFPGARFSFFGDGPTRSELFRQAQRLGVEHRVFFAGTVDDVASVFEASDIFVSPSHYEGLSMSVLEAMSFGMPVVVSNIPGHLKVIWDGVSGLTYELGRADELAEKIALVAGQPQLARRLGSEARSLVEREYDVREMAAAYECLYAG